MLSSVLICIQVEIGVNSPISFEVIGQNVILYGWSTWNGNGNGSSWLVLHFQVLLQRIQDVCARLVMNSRTGVSTEDMKKALHWLPAEQRIIFKINLLTYKCLNQDAPQYLQNLLAVEQLGRLTRSESTCRLKERLVRKKNMVTGPLEILHHRSGIIYHLKSASAPQSTCLNANLRLTCLELLMV